MMLADMHTHSDNSPDGEDTVADLCAAAAEKNLSYIAITDHCEIDLYNKDRYGSRTKQSYFDILAAQDDFGDELGILRGIEIGNPLSDRAVADRVAESRSYDVILGSLHHVSGCDDFAFIDFDAVEPGELLGQYYDELLALVEWGRFDVLTHITYPLRYINGIYKKNISVERFLPQIRRVLRGVIDSGKALEINTSGLRQPYGLTMPGADIVALYREMGGRLITVGSDAHSKKDVGANILDGLRIAKEAGFCEYCIYKERRPVPVRIDIPCAKN